MRTLGIDFGERRIGLAITDTTGVLATPLVTVERFDDRSAIERISEIAEREGVGRIVMGEPLSLDGTATAMATRVRSFARKLSEAIGLPCEFVAESLTSVEAERRLAAAGIDPRREPGRVDALAAQILLEDWLASRSNGAAE